MDTETRNKIDAIWNIFFAGGISNPLTVIEQITYLLFIKSLDDKEISREKNDNLLGITTERTFDEQHQDCRWSTFKDWEAGKMFKNMQDNVFPFIKSLGNNKDSNYSKYMEDALFLIPTPLILQKVVTAIDNLPMKDRDTKGDLYEYLLSKMSTAGTTGQFRTPRHIIRMMVELMQPKSEDIIVDPSCGSAGFLVEAGEYLRENCKEIFTDKDLRNHYNNSMFYGFDMDRTMLRISAMNLMQHGIDNPNIEYKDSLSTDNIDASKYTLVLANPPFKGAIDPSITEKSLLVIDFLYSFGVTDIILRKTLLNCRTLPKPHSKHISPMLLFGFKRRDAAFCILKLFRQSTNLNFIFFEKILLKYTGLTLRSAATDFKLIFLSKF